MPGSSHRALNLLDDSEERLTHPRRLYGAGNTEGAEQNTDRMPLAQQRTCATHQSRITQQRHHRASPTCRGCCSSSGDSAGSPFRGHRSDEDRRRALSAGAPCGDSTTSSRRRRERAPCGQHGSVAGRLFVHCLLTEPKTWGFPTPNIAGAGTLISFDVPVPLFRPGTTHTHSPGVHPRGNERGKDKGDLTIYVENCSSQISLL